MKPQVRSLLAYLRAHPEGATSRDVWLDLGISRLAARVDDLKRDGYSVERVTMVGWQAYMTPEKAARGLHLMDYVQDEPDQVIEYPDLRLAPVFKRAQLPETKRLAALRGL